MLRLAVFFTGILAVSAALAQTVGDGRLLVTVHATGFDAPTGMKFLGPTNNNLFVIEKETGRVQHVAGIMTTTALDLPVNFASHRGLLGIELDPQFAANGFAYLYYSRSSIAVDSENPSEWVENRVSRFHWNGSTLDSEQVLLSFPPLAGQTNGPHHDGGPISFGPDGKLYGIIGDNGRRLAEQNIQAEASVSASSGGIFRIEPSGSPAAGNPFIANSNAEFHKWFAYGIRNSFGIAFDPVTGALWDTENGDVGDNVYDEINHVQAGFNSGWTQIMGPDSRSPKNVSDLVSLAGSAYSDPEFSWLQTIAPTAFTFLHGSQWGNEYNDAVLVGDVNTTRLHLLRLNAARDGFVFNTPELADLVADDFTEESELQFGADFLIPTDIRVGPDKAVYVTTLLDGTIYRIGLLPDPAHPWRNPAEPLDVDRDGIVVPLDALLVINDLDANGAHALPVDGVNPQEAPPPPYLDTDGDNFVAPIDALLIINRLDRAAPVPVPPLGEPDVPGVAMPEPGTATMTAAAAAFFLLAACWRRIAR